MSHVHDHHDQQRPQDETGTDLVRELVIGYGKSLHESGDISMETEFSESNDNHSEEDDLTEQDQNNQLDWDTIALYAPSDVDVPLFQAAKKRRKEAEDRLGVAIDVAFQDLKKYTEDILACAANLYNANQDKLDTVETDIQQLFQVNTEHRLTMERQLEETLTASSAEIERVLMKVSANKRTFIQSASTSSSS